MRKPDEHTSWTARAAVLACGLAAGCAAAPEVQPNHGPPEVIALDAPRTAFVQLFEWKWTDIARECETYLGPKGFAAVQISPPSEHAWYTTGDGAPFPWWMRYQPVSYSLDSSRSGSRAQFIDMVNRCNAVGVGIYVDAVFNHMTSGSGTTSSAGNDPWGVESYPRVPYGPGDFHPTCTVSNYQDANNVQTCQLVGLADLNTSSSYVQGKIEDYLVDLLNIGVKGFRVDAAKHINPADLGPIINAVNARAASQPYWFLEVIGAAGEAVQPSQYFGLDGNLASVTEFAYGQQIFGKFGGGGRLADLKTFGESWGLMPSNRGVAFLDNHDTQRGHAGGGSVLTYHNGSTYDNAAVFMLAWPYGYPVIMSSYAFNTSSAFDTSYGPPFDPSSGATRGPWDGGVSQPACFNQSVGGWVCEHRFRPIGNMVAFRNATVGNWFTSDWWDDGNNQIAFGRGNQGFVVINQEGNALTRSFHTSLPAGSYCEIISGDFTPGTGGAAPTCTGAVVAVDSGGNVTLTAPAFGAAAIHVGAMVPAGTTPPPTPPSTTVTVTFNEAADTFFGQNIFVTGSINELASWSTDHAIPLAWISGQGTRGNWKATLTLPASTHVEYKYIKKDGSSNVTWESGANRVLQTGTGGTSQTTNDAWK
ncbi:MAG TPA: carbohydrate-binding module family 20 domain-containing protein [Kofleriaceae bacterium]|nr:carbohydrate-binding module family 20 domain-containing protein [Kofleriaceae bacterium]